MRITFRLGLFLILIGLGLGPTSAVAAAAKWSRLQTPDFVIFSDASEHDVVEFAVGYAALRHALREFFKPAANLPPSTILLFREKDSMAPYVPVQKEKNMETLSFTAEVDGEALMAISLAGDRAQAMELTYEFEGTWALQRMGYFLPTWMAQGTGEVFASLDVKKGKYRLGEGPDRVRSPWKQMSVIPWQRFFEMGYLADDSSRGSVEGSVQAQSWALMHRILLDDEKGLERFNALAVKLRETGGQAAVESVLGIPATEFAKDIARHFSQKKYLRETLFDDAGTRAMLKITPADEVELHVHLSDIMIVAGRTDEAEGEFRRAQALAPEAVRVKEWLARRELRKGNQEEATRLYREAIAAGSHNAEAYLVSANQRMTASRNANTDREGGGGRDLDESLGEIRQSLRLNPGSAEAYRMLGRAFFLAPKVTDEDAVELSRGIVPGADSGQLLLYRAFLYQRLKRLAEYVADMRQLLAAPATSASTKKFVQGQLVKAKYDFVQSQVTKLAEEKRFAEAHEALAKARGPDPRHDDTDVYEQLDRWLSQGEAWSNLRTLYTEKKWAECKAAAEAFGANFPKSKMLPDAKKIAVQAAQMMEQRE